MSKSYLAKKFFTYWKYLLFRWFSSDLHKIRNLPLWHHHAHISLMRSVICIFYRGCFIQMEKDFQRTGFDIIDNLIQNTLNHLFDNVTNSIFFWGFLFPEQLLSFVIHIDLSLLQQLYGASWIWLRYTPHGMKKSKVVSQQTQNLILEVLLLI